MKFQEVKHRPEMSARQCVRGRNAGDGSRKNVSAIAAALRHPTGAVIGRDVTARRHP
jgi:hypothetical protein